MVSAKGFVCFSLATTTTHTPHTYVRPVRVEALPLKLDFCLTRKATGADYDFIVRRFKAQSAKFGTAVHEAADGRLYVDLP